MLNDILKSVGPIVAAAMAGKFENGEFRFDNGKFRFDGDWDGVPLEELDLTADAPEKLMVFGSTRVTITEGKTFRVRCEGDGADDVRFAHGGGKLAISRCKSGEASGGPATVEITMPAPRALSVAGSGSIHCGALASEARINVAGSGSITLENIECERLKASLMGSGQLTASGTAERLKLTSAGSGSARLADLEVDKARLAITGSGSAELSSDGKVDARMMGSGNVTIYGRATCRVQSMGSGRIICMPRDRRGDEPEAPTPPKSPKPPKSGGAAAKPRKARKAAKPVKAKKMAKTVKKASKKRKSPAKKAD